MNSRQRVLRALRGEQLDRIPRGEVRLDDGFIRALLGFRARRAAIGTLEQRAAIAALDLDLVTLDAFTGAQGLALDLDRLKLRRASEWRDTGLAVVVRVDGPLNRLVKALGIGGAATRLDRGKTRPFGALDLVAARMRGAAQRAAGAGATALLIVDDSPDITPERIPLEHLRRFYRPQLAACLHAAAAVRLPVIVHIAPWHWPLLEEVAQLNPAGLQGLAGRPLAEFRERVGPAICLWGNLERDWLAEPRSLDEAREEVRRMFAAGRPRYLFGTAAGLGVGVNVQTALTLYEAAGLELARPG
jgi:uroporphyrinogen-III decarboxylase